MAWCGHFAQKCWSASAPSRTETNTSMELQEREWSYYLNNEPRDFADCIRFNQQTQAIMFIKSLTTRRVSLELFYAYVSSLYDIYEQIAQVVPPYQVRPIWGRFLVKVGDLKHDLDVLRPHLKKEPDTLRIVDRYADRMEVVNDNKKLLTAHVYVR